ncbi:hypothetical protein [Streptomyces stelliscabiei]|uniref:Uncharacterized protein n=1 Tax=Streptomyces stelliscabiei TaxID=146820 RepID=A0A8I0TS41_9ACTN|nr:hypothetical protein [Streptomyces stelliscabiei]KND30081.1 hypothetical protein IQ64_41415 [Streptomyces stelliscabiei]MBE1599690.1 hypothetical protein [Streptomyces stelliscabiei]MDX2519352.1 hypothetical protein [Streptomyces stelliscabiei]MDX2549718.1 hypothetical protein [Streptomyces stelliscabiei]MDX2616149.1 hypothetical protein [Streptomyces stelliscabiei]
MTTRTATKSTQGKAPTRPDDQPFDFNLDAVKAEVESTPFIVHWNGRRFEFAHMQDLDSWELLAAADGGEANAVMGSLRLALGGEQWKAFREKPLPQYKLMPLFKAWQKHCGMEEGESSASSDS